MLTVDIILFKFKIEDCAVHNNMQFKLWQTLCWHKAVNLTISVQVISGNAAVTFFFQKFLNKRNRRTVNPIAEELFFFIMVRKEFIIIPVNNHF